MTLRNLFIGHTIVFVLVGLSVIFMPTFMADLTNSALTEPEGIQLSRLLGITLLSLAALTWVVRDMKPSVALAGIVSVLALWHGLDAINMIAGVIQESKPAIAWVFPAIHAMISLVFISKIKTSRS